MSPDTTPPNVPPDNRGDNPPAPDPYAAPRGRERMGADSNPDLKAGAPMEPADDVHTRPARRAGRGGFDFRALLSRVAGSSLLGDDPLTRKLVYGAAGLGGVLVVAIGGWSLFGHHQGGIPVLGPPPGPVRVKPADPGGMQILGAGDGMPADGGVMRLSPPPEQPQPDAMARQYGQVTGEGEPTSVPAQATPSAPPATPPAAETPAVTPAPQPATPQRAEAPEPQAEPAQPAALPPPVPRAASTGTGTYGVQLAALDTQEAALKSWTRLSSRYPDVFGPYQPAVVKAERNGKTFYRLRVKGLAKAQAVSLCAKAKAKSLACELVHS
ncbi:SPOR domain-containing protein [Komagataeibacter oboediens]|uniref:SPOR domain-containing protein n=1 Tax=Komagataeibacter oboediens TaxID=65958 RepID=A0ABS5SI97_9PROT|nr:SPOR domain-containing protein [Komagataeibacter oboediens]MBL7234040.1 SPOR domain-containing protein [Komagataeibacter oboediens]MBT0674003.1 SPOR domain-containing protein [Komagataeibacter oboediens]MBT0677275.1 SPOR domain-containing protein [Komagataeibacter oboediens]